MTAFNIIPSHRFPKWMIWALIGPDGKRWGSAGRKPTDDGPPRRLLDKQRDLNRAYDLGLHAGELIGTPG